MNNLIKISLGLGLSLTLVPSAFAQLSPSQSQDGFQRNETNSLYGDDMPINPFELIHRANLSNGRTMGEFKDESAQNIREAAAAFRNQRMLLLRQQQQQPTVTPVSTPHPTVKK